jgi:hypothetical protein
VAVELLAPILQRFRECRYSELAVIRIGTVLGTRADQILKAREIAIGSDLLAMRR